jgi:hypothetical protein
VSVFGGNRGTMRVITVSVFGGTRVTVMVITEREIVYGTGVL